MVRTIPKRLRAYSLYRRRLLGEIARVACLQSHGSRANWRPHLHLLVTNGGVRPDWTVVTRPVPDTVRLTQAFRRAVRRLFVRLALFEEEQAAGMLTWPHSGFHVHTAVWEGPFGSPRTIAHSRPPLAQYCARNPVASKPLTYDRAEKAVIFRSDKSEGPTAGPDAGPPEPGHDTRRTPARRAALARSAIARSVRRIVDPPD